MKNPPTARRRIKSPRFMRCLPFRSPALVAIPARTAPDTPTMRIAAVLSITSKSPYALRALTQLGRTGGDAPVPIGELARRRDIPVQFLEQLFSSLRRAGILSSQRGVKGGYRFAREPSEVTAL